MWAICLFIFSLSIAFAMVPHVNVTPILGVTIACVQLPFALVRVPSDQIPAAADHLWGFVTMQIVSIDSNREWTTHSTPSIRHIHCVSMLMLRSSWGYFQSTDPKGSARTQLLALQRAGVAERLASKMREAWVQVPVAADSFHDLSLSSNHGYGSTFWGRAMRCQLSSIEADLRSLGYQFLVLLALYGSHNFEQCLFAADWSMLVRGRDFSL